jgi:hypothetical protein
MEAREREQPGRDVRREGRNLDERYERDDRTTLQHLTSFLEPEVLERFRRAPVQRRRPAVVAAPRLEIALGNP